VPTPRGTANGSNQAPVVLTMSAFVFVTLIALAAQCQAVDTVGSWSKVTDLTRPRSDLGSSTLGDQIILTGGCLGPQARVGPACDAFACQEITDLVEAFDPASKNFVRLPDMPRKRYRHSSEVIDNILYVIGGRDLNDNIITQVDYYNPVTKQWNTSGITMDNWASDFSTFTRDNLIYLVGGYFADYTVCSGVASFSPSRGFDYNSIPVMTEARGDTCSVFIDDSIYVIGGFRADDFSKPVSTIEIYSFKNVTWYFGEPTIHPGGDKACGVLNGRIRSFGGEGKLKFNDTCSYSDPEDDTEEFTLSTKTWSDEPTMDTPRFRFAAEYYQTNVIYIFGGQGRRDAQADAYRTLSSVEVWSDKNSGSVAAMSLGLVLACLFAVLL